MPSPTPHTCPSLMGTRARTNSPLLPTSTQLISPEISLECLIGPCLGPGAAAPSDSLFSLGGQKDCGKCEFECVILRKCFMVLPITLGVMDR